MRRALAGVALLLAGCGGADGLVLTYRGSPDSLPAAELAVEEWRQVCGVDVSLGPDGVPVVETDAEVSDGAIADTRVQMSSGKPLWIHFRPGKGRRAVFAHEIGHALGLQHTPDGVDDIMTGKPLTDDQHVTLADCARLGTVR